MITNNYSIKIEKNEDFSFYVEGKRITLKNEHQVPPSIKKSFKNYLVKNEQELLKTAKPLEIKLSEEELLGYLH